MPESFSKKDERQYEHIKDSASKRGRSSKTAKRIAAATVNKRRSQEGRTKSKSSSRSRSGSSSPRKSTRGRTSTLKRSTAKRTPARRPKRTAGSGPIAERTFLQLRVRASELEIHGRGRMNKAQLVRAINRRGG